VCGEYPISGLVSDVLLGAAFLQLSLLTAASGAESGRAVSAESGRAAAQGACAVGAVLFASVALSCGWVSGEHWVNRSRALWWGLLVIAIGLTLFLLVRMIG
jgi:hypothetical protein